ncbi:homocysteine S-methyltransferase [Streptomyces sp. NPDC058953]|uniref:homocysteine S-methyltransferase n=1 Tax=unclassified Streptomyces TaxID=2593676 RepID=UPI0036C5CB08
MRPARPLGDVLARGALVLDGGLATLLEEWGHDLSGELWSARLLMDEPGVIGAAHRAYAAAGARVLTTASYQASFEGFARGGKGRAAAEALFARSVALARSAADEAGAETWVAASVGPYGAVLADGGEYRGRYGLSVRELERFHRPRIEALAAAAPDALALETVPDAVEAEALLRAVEGCGVPVWLSYTISGERTRAGQDLGPAFGLVRGVDQVIAVGVNCCEPADTAGAVALAAEVTGKPVVAYPNSGEAWDGRRKEWYGPVRYDPGRVRDWLEAGARLVGGCCRVGPGTVEGIAAAVSGETPPGSAPPGSAPPGGTPSGGSGPIRG